jgi:hypothetical protein
LSPQGQSQNHRRNKNDEKKNFAKNDAADFHAQQRAGMHPPPDSGGTTISHGYDYSNARSMPRQESNQSR